MLPLYVKLPLPQGSHQGFHFLFLHFGHIALMHFLATAKQICLNLHLFFDIHQLFCLIDWVSIYICTYGHFCRFFALHFYSWVINMIHDQHIYHKWHMSVILFLYGCPEPPIGISTVGFYPVWSGDSLIYFQAL